MPPEVEVAELPVASVIDPELPALEVPVDNAMAPLAPFVPAFCVVTYTWPLVVV